MINDQQYSITGATYHPYGQYFKASQRDGAFQYIATCYKANGEWAGIKLYHLHKLETLRRVR